MERISRRWLVVAALWLGCIQSIESTEGRDSPSPATSRGTVDERLDQIEAKLHALSRGTPDGTLGMGHVDSFPDGEPIPPCIEEPPAWPTWRVTGFFQLDAGFFSQDAANRATLGDIQDGLGFRRARLAAVGEVEDRVGYHLEFDFAQAQPRFVDVWMQFDETPMGNLRIGRYRQPFGMAEQTSIREIGFLERPMTFALAPFRQTGVMLFDTALDESIAWFVSGYRYLSDNYGNVYADGGGYGMAARLTTVLLQDDSGHLIHLGVDYSYNDPGLDSVKYFSSNEIFVGQNPLLGAAGLPVLPLTSVPAFVNTGAMPTRRTSLFDVEGAVALGRLTLQSEARWARVDMPGGVTNTFPGAYVQVRYVLTGEEIPYHRKNGVFARVEPLEVANPACGGWGAWEIAARLSYLDLNGTALPGPGRHLTDVTLGINWYINAHTKFQCSWIHADLADPALGDSTADTLAVRGQIGF